MNKESDEAKEAMLTNLKFRKIGFKNICMRINLKLFLLFIDLLLNLS